MWKKCHRQTANARIYKELCNDVNIVTLFGTVGNFQGGWCDWRSKGTVGARGTSMRISGWVAPVIYRVGKAYTFIWWKLAGDWGRWCGNIYNGSSRCRVFAFSVLLLARFCTSSLWLSCKGRQESAADISTSTANWFSDTQPVEIDDRWYRIDFLRAEWQVFAVCVVLQKLSLMVARSSWECDKSTYVAGI